MSGCSTCLPPEMLREIARFADPRTLAALSRATKYTRKSLPVGLAVTRVGPRPVSFPRQVVNRSRSVAKASPLRFSRDVIDRTNPAAYKNNTWRFYFPWSRDYILFTNTRNGQPFIIDKKTGARKPVPARLGVVNGPLQFLQNRKPGFHTWSEYVKRSMKNRRLVAGTSVRNARRHRSDFQEMLLIVQTLPHTRTIRGGSTSRGRETTFCLQIHGTVNRL